jgi:peptide deformylase
MHKIVQDLSILRRKSDPVASVEEATGLITTLRENLDKMNNGVGLAAIQIGVPKKVAVIRVAPDKYLNLINPELEEGMDKFVFLSEGCLSIPGYFQDTNRYRQIIIKNQVIDGDKFREERQMFYYPISEEDGCSKISPLTCIAVQHELEHFEGKLITENTVKRNPIVVKGNKVGRNDPCPCGSGKKYKKCCIK